MLLMNMFQESTAGNRDGIELEQFKVSDDGREVSTDKKVQLGCDARERALDSSTFPEPAGSKFIYRLR